MKIKEKYLLYHEGEISINNDESLSRNGFNLILPPWLCQPYVRMSPEEHTKKMEKLNTEQVTLDNNLLHIHYFFFYIKKTTSLVCV